MCGCLMLVLGQGTAAAEEAGPAATEQTVVLLHGLGRSRRSMGRPARRLEAAGYEVCNIGYPSRRHDIAKLVDEHVLPAIEECVSESTAPLHFVTHSLGGIVVRQLAASHPDIPIGRVVMLSPPNQGSELVDYMGGWWLFKLINGPAGGQLGTAADSLPNRLGPVDFELGVITGDDSVFYFSRLIPGDDDGKVAVARAKQAGMADFLVLPHSHSFIMRQEDVIQQTLYFLANGAFAAP